MTPADGTITIGVGLLVSLLWKAYNIGKEQQKINGSIAELRTQLNGVGKKVGKIILFLQETAKGPERQRLTDVLKD